MSLGKHALIGIGVGSILYPFVGINALWFLISSTLIDIDHYVAFIIQSRFTNFNLKSMFNYYDTLLSWKQRDDMLGISTFHTLEFLGAVGIYAFVLKSWTLTIISLGLSFHFICDLIFLLREGALFRRANSFLEFFIRRYYMKKKGIDANRALNDALELVRSQ